MPQISGASVALSVVAVTVIVAVFALLAFWEERTRPAQGEPNHAQVCCAHCHRWITRPADLAWEDDLPVCADEAQCHGTEAA